MESRKLFDIAANLSEKSFQPDLGNIIKRAAKVGVEYLLLAGTHLPSSENASQICNIYKNCFFTAGVHPCSSKVVNALDVYEYFQKIQQLAQEKSCVAIGECGLDYDRFEYASKDQQLLAFEPHFQVAEETKKPMYLHNRNTGDDFYNIVRQNRHRFTGGVVHSFTGTVEEAQKVLSLDLFIGINGCSLKTPENLEVLKQIPLDKMMIETDCPYCEIRKTHAGYKYVKTFFKEAKKITDEEQLVRGRNEPCKVVQVLEVVSQVKQIPEEEIAQVTFQNSVNLFLKNLIQP